MDNEFVILSKLFFLSFIHSNLIAIFLYLRSFKILHIILLASIFSFIIYFLNFFLWNSNYKTFYIFNATILTIIYFEFSIILEKFFFRGFLENSLPISINYIISFTLMINAAYFTLMLIYHVFK